MNKTLTMLALLTAALILALSLAACSGTQESEDLPPPYVMDDTDVPTDAPVPATPEAAEPPAAPAEPQALPEDADESGEEEPEEESQEEESGEDEEESSKEDRDNYTLAVSLPGGNSFSRTAAADDSFSFQCVLKNNGERTVSFPTQYTYEYLENGRWVPLPVDSTQAFAAGLVVIGPGEEQRETYDTWGVDWDFVPGTYRVAQQARYTDTNGAFTLYIEFNVE